MKKVLLCIVCVLLLVGGGCQKVRKIRETRAERTERFIDTEMAVIQEKTEILRHAGRFPTPDQQGAISAYTLIGQYRWHGDGHGYSGAYSFYQPAFEQAMRSWWIHGKITRGSDLLVALNPNAKFEPSIVGHKVGPIYMRDGTPAFPGDYLRDTTVISFVDEHTVRLDHAAEHDGEQYGLGITPPDYQDLCDCTNNFNPFRDTSPGKPIPEKR